MTFGRVPLNLGLFCLQRFYVVNKLPVQKHFYTVNCKVNAFTPITHKIGLQVRSQSCVCLPSVMQAAGISYGPEANVASDDEDEDDEACFGGGGGRVGQQSTSQEIINEGQVVADNMEVPTETRASTVSSPMESNKTISRNKMRKEKMKLKKKKLKSAEASASLMSELPFALTSPTAWKELGFPIPESSEKKRKRKRGDSGGGAGSEEDGDQKKKKKESQRPNYFVSIPITNIQIKSAVTEIQEAILLKEPRLAKAMIPVPTLHITLLVTHLASQEQVALAGAVLAQAEPTVAELLSGRDLVLPFSGIGDFRKEVVFVGLTSGLHRHTLDSLAELLRCRFEEQGLLQGDGRGFEPHLTIMKLSRASKLRSQGVKRVGPALYSEYTDKFFGNQMVERVDLCSMLKKKQQDGYYHTETSLQLGGRRRSEQDEAELLRVSKRLVEDAVNRALQQYKQETLQNGGGPNVAAVQPPGSTEETPTKTDTTANSSTDNRK
uniref:A kinase (PRKA) anchor protein 7 n=1 Tax=Nothobranchius rachovii TaxID=451742 RepID=A0A1A8NWQ9_9TELE